MTCSPNTPPCPAGWDYEFSFPDTDPCPPPVPVPLRCRCGVLRDTLVPWPEPGGTHARDAWRMCTSCGWQGVPGVAP